MNQNLEVLAQFAEQRITDCGTRGNKLSISATGRFERDSGIGGAFSRTFSRTEQSFTSQRIQNLIMTLHLIDLRFASGLTGGFCK